MKALAMPTTKPASSACNRVSIENPSRIAAKSHNMSAVTTVTTTPRHSTCRTDGRSSAGRKIRDACFVVHHHRVPTSRTSTTLLGPDEVVNGSPARCASISAAISSGAL